jgi:hypothetical protein
MREQGTGVFREFLGAQSSEGPREVSEPIEPTVFQLSGRRIMRILARRLQSGLRDDNGWLEKTWPLRYQVSDRSQGSVGGQRERAGQGTGRVISGHRRSPPVLGVPPNAAWNFP